MVSQLLSSYLFALSGLSRHVIIIGKLHPLN